MQLKGRGQDRHVQLCSIPPPVQTIELIHLETRNFYLNTSMVAVWLMCPMNCSP